MLEDVNPVTNMDINKDVDDAVSQHNWILEFILLIPLVLSLTFDAFQVVLLLSGDTVLRHYVLLLLYKWLLTFNIGNFGKF